MVRLMMVGLVLVALIAGCDKKEKQSESDADDKEKKSKLLDLIDARKVPVRTKPLAKRMVREYYRSTATLRAERDVEIHILEGELVQKIDHYVGDQVKEGDVIARMHSPKLEREMAKARLTFEDANRVHKGNESLLEQKLISQEEWETSSSQLRQARLTYDQVRNRADQQTIKAPFAGMVAKNNLQLGAHVSNYQQQPPLRVVDKASLLGEFALPVLYVGWVKPGREFTIEARGQSSPASVSRIAPVVDKSTGTVLVEFRVQNVEDGFLPGELVNLSIPHGEGAEHLVLPENSVVFEGNKTFVFGLRTSNPEEIEREVKKLKGEDDDEKDKDRGKGKKKGRGHKGMGSMDPKRGKAAESLLDEDYVVTAEEHKALAETLRVEKNEVKVIQLPSGLYALTEDKSGKLKEGDQLVIVGLSQIANGSLIEVKQEF